MVNFGIVYGITPFGLARRLGIENGAAAEIIDGYKKRFAGITTFLQECVEQARRHGYVETMLRRRRPIVDIESNNPQRRALAERVAINSVVQGSAADLIKLAMVDIARLLSGSGLRPGSGGAAVARGMPRMLLQIHDELVFEAPDDQAIELMGRARNAQESMAALSVPLVVDAQVSKNWYDGK